MAKSKFSAVDVAPEIAAETIEVARNWKPEKRHMSATDYYKRHGVAPKGHVVYIGGRVFDEAGEVRGQMAPNDPNRLSKPRGWK